MLLNFILIQCISVALAKLDLTDISELEETLKEEEEAAAAKNQLVRVTRMVLNNEKPDGSICDQYEKTFYTGFLCIILYRNSGRFVGMGSILDKKTVLTASKVVSKAFRKPRDLLVLAGRFNPYWGKNSQVKQVDELFVKDLGLAIARIRDQFHFNKRIWPARLWLKFFDTNSLPDPNQHLGVFGFPRSSWDIPGDYLPKTSVYLLQIVTQPKGGDIVCKDKYKDEAFTEKVQYCSYSNGSFFWGILGSPSMYVNNEGELLQLGVVVKTPEKDNEEYVFHSKIYPHIRWLNSRSLIPHEKVEETWV